MFCVEDKSWRDFDILPFLFLCELNPLILMLAIRVLFTAAFERKDARVRGESST